MKTNFKKLTKLVLVDNSHKVMAIISVDSGVQDISEKVAQAIKEDTGCYSVMFTNNIDFSEQNIFDDLDFRAEIEDDEDENTWFSFTLIPTQEY